MNEWGEEGVGGEEVKRQEKVDLVEDQDGSSCTLFTSLLFLDWRFL